MTDALPRLDTELAGWYHLLTVPEDYDEEADLEQAIATAFAHCRPGGVALFLPDFVRETFVEQTDHGGHDGPDRALRYLAWTHELDPTGTTFVTDFVYLLRETGRPIRHLHDRHIRGVFPRATWVALPTRAGFSVRPSPVDPARVTTADIFVGVRPVHDPRP